MFVYKKQKYEENREANEKVSGILQEKVDEQELQEIHDDYAADPGE